MSKPSKDPIIRREHRAGGLGRQYGFADCLERVARQRSRSDYRIVFEHFAPRVKSFLLKRGADDIQAEELTQEIMATVWTKAGQYDRNQAAVSTWIFRIARNRQIDQLRRERRPQLDPKEPLLQPTAQICPEAAIFKSEDQAKLRAELRQLPEEQLRLLKASFYDGLPHAEIAERFGLPLGTVKSRIRLAFRKLRDRLHEV
ncbi:MAG: sigma-70 family RNA polymerase sigma factor [Pseudomonadota bacterium]